MLRCLAASVLAAAPAALKYEIFSGESQLPRPTSITTGALIPLGASQDVVTPTFKLASLASIMRCRAPSVCVFNSWAGPDSSLPPRATTMASTSIK